VKHSLAVALLALSVPAVAQQDDRARTEALAERATGRLQVLHREADRLATEARTLLGDLRRLELERRIRTEELRQLDAESAAIVVQLEDLTRDASELEAQQAREEPEVRARLVALYKLGRASYFRLWLSTDGQHLAQASRMIAALAKRDRDRLDAYVQRRGEITAARATLEERNARLKTLRAETEAARLAAARAVAERNVLIRDIDRQRDLNARLAGELQEAQQKLQVTLRELAGGRSDVEPVFLPLAPFQGELAWPIAGTAQRSRSSPNGVEIPASEGIPVAAIHDGTVAFADAFAGFGNLVIVDHGGQTFSLYGHLLEMSVAPGAPVAAGQPIGSVGQTTTGPAGLYFELRIEGRPVDPLQWLRRNQSR
jgi:septal ring factor EnvC (AmiA/AmiB activator)